MSKTSVSGVGIAGSVFGHLSCGQIRDLLLGSVQLQGNYVPPLRRDGAIDEKHQDAADKILEKILQDQATFARDTE